MGISSANPHETFTRPLGGTKWFKGLVAYAKCNHDSYGSELDLKILFFGFTRGRAKFKLLEDEQSLSVGVFVWVLT